jgi:hypothetical protein
MIIQLKYREYIIPYNLEQQFIKNINNDNVLFKKGEYGKIKNKKTLIKLIDYYQNSFYYAQLVSLRSHLLKQKVLYNFLKINKEQIIDMFKIKSVAQISQILDICPSHVKKIVKCDKEIDDITFDSGKELCEGDEFEKIVQNKLDELGVTYQTQSSLVEEQIKKYGNPISTPDFLITSELYIDNIRISWIDAKAFYGTRLPLFFNSMKKQAKKYETYGNGAFIFKYGFTEDFRFTFEKTICVDWVQIKKL